MVTYLVANYGGQEVEGVLPNSRVNYEVTLRQNDVTYFKMTIQLDPLSGD